MQANTKKNLYVLLVIFLVSLVLIIGVLLGGVLMLKNNGSTTTTTEKENEYLNKINNDFIELTSNNNVNFKYELKCTETQDSECLASTFIINNKSYDVGPTAEIFYTSNYILLKDDGGAGFVGTFKILDYQGKEIVSKEHIGTICDDKSCEYFGIKSDDYKIYYIEHTNDKLYLKYFDLNDNFNNKTLIELTKYHVAG